MRATSANPAIAARPPATTTATTCVMSGHRGMSAHLGDAIIA
jgi:hypothetical protein